MQLYFGWDIFQKLNQWFLKIIESVTINDNMIDWIFVKVLGQINFSIDMVWLDWYPRRRFCKLLLALFPPRFLHLLKNKFVNLGNSYIWVYYYKLEVYVLSILFLLNNDFFFRFPCRVKVLICFHRDCIGFLSKIY